MNDSLEFEAAIGMECHAELLTDTKMFCGCKNKFGGQPNRHCCPVCLAMPGALPVINRQAVEFVVRAALALNCEINQSPKFDRKNYFYPDLPKGYQISEYASPIGANGWIDIEVGTSTKRVHIERVHLEEDTGKLFHMDGDDIETFVDLNRSGVPLMEIVTKFPPDIQSSEEARAYVVKLHSILTYIGVCDGKMQEGSLRCEPNVSIRAKGTEPFGTKTEIKNLNSFRSVQKGIDYEVSRQIAVVEAGQKVHQETRGWDEAKQITFVQRSKEVEQEYRYFPDPDLLPLEISADWVQKIHSSIPELADARKKRFMLEYALPPYDADYLTQERELADYFEEATRLSNNAKLVSNWVMGDLSRLLNQGGRSIVECPVTPGSLSQMVVMIEEGHISGKMGKVILEEAYSSGKSPQEIVEAKGLRMVNDSSVLLKFVEKVFSENPQIVADIREREMVQKKPFLVGQIMKMSNGRADPREVNRLVDERLGL